MMREVADRLEEQAEANEEATQNQSQSANPNHPTAHNGAI